MLNFNAYIKENYTDYKESDIVLIRYWLTGDITPVKIIEQKTKNYYIVSHKIEYSQLFNAPNHGIKKSEIMGLYQSDEPLVSSQRRAENPRTNPNIGGFIPGGSSWSDDIAF